MVNLSLWLPYINKTLQSSQCTDQSWLLRIHPVFIFWTCLTSLASRLSHFVGLDEFITHALGHNRGLIPHHCLYPIWWSNIITHHPELAAFHWMMAFTSCTVNGGRVTAHEINLHFYNYNRVLVSSNINLCLVGSPVLFLFLFIFYCPSHCSFYTFSPQCAFFPDVPQYTPFSSQWVS